LLNKGIFSITGNIMFLRELQTDKAAIHLFSKRSLCFQVGTRLCQTGTVVDRKQKGSAKRN